MDFNPPELNLVAALPALLLSAWALLLLLVDLWIPPERKTTTALLALAGAVGTLAVVLFQWSGASTPAEAFPPTGMFVLDRFTLANTVIALLAAGLTILLSISFLPRMRVTRGEYYPLLLFSVAGMVLMAAAADLIMVFLALELLSIPLYILAGLLRPRPDSEESALKYFLLGAFSSGFLVYGIALVYGGVGSTRLADIVPQVAALAANTADGRWPILLAGIGLLLVGFGFKVAAVPFHMWTPDVYQGAPTTVTAFMSVGAKVGGFAGLLRVFLTAFPELANIWWPAIALIAMATMIVGNLFAVVQPNFKRMLGYSSIAHAGYILIAVAAAGASPAVAPFALSAALFYLLAYTFTNLGAFGAAIAVEEAATGDTPPAPGDPPRGVLIEEYAGLGKTHTWLALAMALFMLSLTGIPPTGGFMGKFYLFGAAVQAVTAGAPVDAWMVALVITGVVTSVISAFFYLRVVVVMFMREGAGAAVTHGALAVALALTALGTLWLGLLPGSVVEAVKSGLFGP